MTRERVESLVGKPLGVISVDRLVREGWDRFAGSVWLPSGSRPHPVLDKVDETWSRAAWYSKRTGLCGWRYWVIYDASDRVADTKYYQYSD